LHDSILMCERFHLGSRRTRTSRDRLIAS
jgi:hypothetical protein